MATPVRRGLMVVDDLFDQAELDLLVGVAASLDFSDQELGRGVIGRRQRAVTDDRRVPTLLWTRIAPVLPPLAALFPGGPGTPSLDPPISSWRAVGCNPRTRFYRYPMGAAFSEHEDEPWRPDATSRTLLTVLVYLPTGGCVGGETVIDGEVVTVVDGRTVVFDHGLLHEGKAVEAGQKLTLRSDILARPEEDPAPCNRW